MFTLAWGLYSSLFGEKTYKVLIIGLESSGKTTLMEQLKCTYIEGCSATTERGGSGADALPTPAEATVMKKKRILPTVGLNVARATHRTIPPQTYSSSNRGSVCRDSFGDVRASASITSLPPGTPSTPFTPTATRLVLWDVGGSLRTLWANYFAPCHGVIFVVDSTLGFSTAPASAAVVAAAQFNGQADSSSSMTTPSSHSVACGDSSESHTPSPPFKMPTPLASPPFNEQEKRGAAPPGVLLEENEEARRKAIREAHAQNAAVLREVFSHPLLIDAPLLILSNKTDEMHHCSLADLQEALGLVQMALMQEVYKTDCGVDCSCGGKRHSCASDESDNLGGSTSNRGRSLGGVDATGTSGIGNKIIRLVEASALDGTGVREAMDWLVFQMRDSKRVTVDEGG
ncbi:Arf/Sar family, other [Trypanosoma grayi]|uniref:Arf/Sar family, other n=1 Tax=Trypanosoma grayi TaxID=71804 RepID=UPI0004F446C1|nr:Arf/Sar family, other [Trypanosoma grayi]KEG11486.1 Arf/Sar family, other [Trypanosoma grayi]